MLSRIKSIISYSYYSLIIAIALVLFSSNNYAMEANKESSLSLLTIDKYEEYIKKIDTIMCSENTFSNFECRNYTINQFESLKKHLIKVVNNNILEKDYSIIKLYLKTHSHLAYFYLKLCIENSNNQIFFDAFENNFKEFKETKALVYGVLSSVDDKRSVLLDKYKNELRIDSCFGENLNLLNKNNIINDKEWITACAIENVMEQIELPIDKPMQPKSIMAVQQVENNNLSEVIAVSDDILENSNPFTITTSEKKNKSKKLAIWQNAFNNLFEAVEKNNLNVDNLSFMQHINDRRSYLLTNTMSVNYIAAIQKLIEQLELLKNNTLTLHNKRATSETTALYAIVCLNLAYLYTGIYKQDLNNKEACERARAYMKELKFWQLPDKNFSFAGINTLREYYRRSLEEELSLIESGSKNADGTHISYGSKKRKRSSE